MTMLTMFSKPLKTVAEPNERFFSAVNNCLVCHNAGIDGGATDDQHCSVQNHEPQVATATTAGGTSTGTRASSNTRTGTGTSTGMSTGMSIGTAMSTRTSLGAAPASVFLRERRVTS
eukprot:scaffold251302_cov15-Tisochrysis_lutea.AAC.1